MIKSILVCTDGSAYGTAACEYGIYLTQKMQGQLSALHVLDSRMLEGPLMSDISGWVGAQPYGNQLQQFRDLLQQRGETIINAIHDRCAAAGLTINAMLKMGHPVHVILEEEANAELVILGQKGEHVDFVGEMMGSTVENVVRKTLKPCLVTPEEFKPFTKVLAAFDGSNHSSRALHEAIELSQGLSLPLSILTVAEDKDFDRANQITKDGLRLAQAHQCNATHLVAKGPPYAAILEMAEKHHFDLIVMGAYGHSRIREMILGSTTTQIVRDSKIPIMLVR
jgi:nucleotide-binding universal stress UspA family protein